MNNYELMIIVNAQMPQDAKENIFKQAVDVVAKAGGKVLNSIIWLEKHKFAFKIKHCWEGTYYLIKFESAASLVDKIKPLLRLNETILRFAIIRAE